MDAVFHAGERHLQRLHGVEAEARRVSRIVRPDLSPAALGFLGDRSWLVVSSVDAAGRPWASILAGEPGFLSAPTPGRLRIAASPVPGDPLADDIAPGAPLGLLIVDLATRRRLRANGRRVADPGPGIEVALTEVFSNCPKYIQAREPVDRVSPAAPSRVRQVTALTPALQRWVATADTLFLATHHPQAGADASHRGGPPGFVHVLSGRRLAFPDYPGNNLFNSLGNLIENPACGLLFVDFARGDTLQLTGRARVVATPDGEAAVPGQDRVKVEIDLTAGVEIAGALPLRFGPPEPYPFLPRP